MFVFVVEVDVEAEVALARRRPGGILIHLQNGLIRFAFVGCGVVFQE